MSRETMNLWPSAKAVPLADVNLRDPNREQGEVYLRQASNNLATPVIYAISTVGYFVVSYGRVSFSMNLYST